MHGFAIAVSIFDSALILTMYIFGTDIQCLPSFICLELAFSIFLPTNQSRNEPKHFIHTIIDCPCPAVEICHTCQWYHRSILIVIIGSLFYCFLAVGTAALALIVFGNFIVIAIIEFVQLLCYLSYWIQGFDFVKRSDGLRCSQSVTLMTSNACNGSTFWCLFILPSCVTYCTCVVAPVLTL